MILSPHLVEMEPKNGERVKSSNWSASDVARSKKKKKNGRDVRKGEE